MKRLLALLTLLGCSTLSGDGDQPESCGPIAQQTVFTGNTTTFDVCFTSPAGSELSYDAGSSDVDVVLASIQDTTVTISGVSPGSATVTVTATDAEGRSTDLEIAVLVPNRAPETVGSIEAILVRAGASRQIDIAGFFNDPDAESLTYGVETADAGVATATVSDALLEVTGVSTGSTTLRVIASDPAGESATQTVSVQVTDIAEIFVDQFDHDTGRWDYNSRLGGPGGGMKIDDGQLSVWSYAPYFGIAETHVGAEAWTVTVRVSQTDNPQWAGIGVATGADDFGTTYYLLFGDNRGLPGSADGDIEVLVFHQGQFSIRPTWRNQINLRVQNFYEVSFSLLNGTLSAKVNDETVLEINDLPAANDRIEKLRLLSNPRNDDAQGQPVLFDWVRVEGALTSVGGVR